MSKASTGFAFVAGLTIGAAGAWYYLKDKYAKLAESKKLDLLPRSQRLRFGLFLQ